MAVNIITKFVLGQFAKRSARKSEGIATLLKASDPVVQSNVRNIEIILKNMGIDPKNLKSTDDVLKHMNIHKSLMNQSLKQGFKGLDLDKGIKSLEKTKKPWHEGWTPKIVKTKPEDKKIPMFERHQKEIKDVDTESAGMGFYSEMSDLMKRQRLEELELDYDMMFNKILEKAKRIDADPKVLLEAELGKKLTGKETTTQLLDIFKNRPKKASGGIARVGMLTGGFTKAQVLIQMIKNTLKGSKDPYVKKTFPNFIKELTKNPELANDPNVWKQFTTGLPKNQRLVVHSDDSVDFFTQSEFGPHNIEKTLEFQKKHNLSRDQANTILRMEPEDRVLEMKRIETIRNKTMQADGGRIGMMYGGDPGFQFEYGGSWADWRDSHQHQMPVTDYIKTKLPKERLPFRELQSGGLAYMLGEPTYMNRPGYRKGLGVEKKKKKEYRMPPMFPMWREPINYPYKSLEDIPPEVLDMLKKDPVFDLDTFLKKVAWSDPDKTRIQERIKGEDEAWGITSGMTGDMLLNYQKFGKGEKLPASGIVLKHIKDKDKVSTILHEMRHAKMAEPWFAKSSAIPKWVQKYEEEGEPHYLDRDIKDKHKQYRKTQKDVSGEELYIRYLDQLYSDMAEKGDLAGSEYKPYFDKILRDKWAPHAKAYKEILEAEKSEMAKPVFRDEFRNRKDYPLKSGGLAGQLHLNRPGYSSGLLVKLAKLLKGKKKNVWRGFETDYKNILRGDWYPEEFSGRFFTPDKDLAKWYAMRQGTLTGKVKKLKLTEKEIKAAQEFAEKNLDIQYGDDLLVSKELAEKAKVDLPATALAKIEAVIRKAKRTKKAKKHGQTDWAEGGIARASGGLAYMLGEPTYMKYEGGGSVGHAPWHKPTGHAQPTPHMDTPTPNVASRPDPLKAPRGLPSVAPKNMDPAFMQQKMMQQAMMGRGPGNTGQGPRPMAAEGGRIGFKLGGIDKGRRAFMKWLAGIMGTGVAAGTGLLKLGTAAKVAKPAAVVTETIIKSNAPGMPVWFPSLVKRVLKEGKDETEKLATLERQTVHTAKTPEGTPIQVTRDLATDDIVVDIGTQTKHGWSAGRHGQPVRLELKKGEWIEPSTEGGGYMTKGGDNVYPGMSKGALETEKTTGKGMKTKDEFTVQEAEFTGGHPENVKFEETVEFKYGDHGSDFSEIEQYATKSPVTSGSSHGEVQRSLRREGWHGKKEKAHQLAMDKKHGGLKSTYKQDPHVRGKQADKDAWAAGRAESAADDIDDFASGGLAHLLGE